MGIKNRTDEKWKGIYRKMGLVFLSAGIVSVLVFVADNRQSLPVDKDGNNVLKRNSYGEGERTEELRIQIGDNEENYTVTVGEQKYSEEELQKVFEQSAKLSPYTHLTLPTILLV